MHDKPARTLHVEGLHVYVSNLGYLEPPVKDSSRSLGDVVELEGLGFKAQGYLRVLYMWLFVYTGVIVRGSSAVSSHFTVRF